MKELVMKKTIAGTLMAIVCSIVVLGGAETTAVTDKNTTPVLWEKTEWGELGLGEFKFAPYPDDSRTTGYMRNKKLYTFEEHYNDSSAAIAIPEGFDGSGRIDFVVICHGHNNNSKKMMVENRLGYLLKDSGRNAILITPQGPKNVADSGGGKFEKPDSFAKFIYEVLSVLQRDGRVDKNSKLGNVIIAGFSGGGRPASYIIKNSGLADHLVEAWLIDAAYGQLDMVSEAFTDAYSKKYPQVLRSLFTNHLAQNNALLMARIGTPHGRNVCVVDDAFMQDIDNEIKTRMKQNPILFMHTLLPHNAFKMAARYIEPMIETSRFLRPIPAKEK